METAGLTYIFRIIRSLATLWRGEYKAVKAVMSPDQRVCLHLEGEE